MIMKKLILLLVAVLMAPVVYAQSSLVATLSHGEEITMYYGSYALRDAHNAAVSGDVINLSGGGFQAVNITKAVTIRGTGIDVINPTVIMNYFTINIPTDDENRFSMEGIRCNSQITMTGSFNNPYFQKCQLNTIYYNNSSIYNTVFANCKITGNSFTLTGTSSVQFVNSYTPELHVPNEVGETTSASFVNCIIHVNNNPAFMRNAQLINCIIYDPTSSWGNAIPSSSVATNCITIGNSYLFDNSQTNLNCQSATFAQVFKDFTGTYSDTQTFELTDEAKTQFLGTDGTEVGLYGGMLPYTSTPSYPRITKMNVANKTTADGKLSVELEVSAAE